MIANVCEHLTLVGVFAGMVWMAVKREFTDEVGKKVMSWFNISQTSMETGTDVAK